MRRGIAAKTDYYLTKLLASIANKTRRIDYNTELLLNNVVTVSTGVISVWWLYCFLFGGRMGCGGSKNTGSAAAGSSYQERKKNNFKDPGLEKHMQDCAKQKKKLRHVEDPDVARKMKQKVIAQQQKTEAKGGPLGLTENELQQKRKNLKHRS